MRGLTLILLLVACSKKESAATVDASPQPSVASSAVPIEIDASPSVQHWESSFAHFEKGQLSQCIDMVFELPLGVDAGKDPLGSETTGVSNKEATRLSEKCRATFTDRILLATCNIDQADAGTSMHMTVGYYDFGDISGSDKQMAECLSSKGKWRAISRDSKEWQKAKFEYDRRNLRRAVDRLDKQPADEP